MTRQLLIYEDPVPLSSEAHRDLSVRGGRSCAFARGVNSVPVLLPEFEKIATDAPIVFAGEGDDMMPAVLLGLEDNRNLFVDADGSWTGGYVPAFLRRYPFVLATRGEGSNDLVLCIDRAFDGINDEGRGERLFDSEGNRTAYLETSLAFARDFHAQQAATQAAVARLAALGLFEPATATATLPDGRSMTLQGFRKISPEKLGALDDAAVLSLFRDGLLALIHVHLVSLGQMQGLLGRLRDRAPA